MISRTKVSLLFALTCLAVSLLVVPAHALALGMDGYEPDNPGNMPTLLVDQQSAQERTLNMGDLDFTRVHVEVGKSYVFTVLAKPDYSGSVVRMTLWPDAAPDQWVSSLQQSTTIPGSGLTEIRFTATETGSVVLQIESDPPLSGECAYWLAAYTDGQPWWEDPYEVPEVDPNSAGTFANVNGPVITRSLAGMGDVDTVDIFIPEPGQYVISTGFSSLGVAPDTSLEVWDFGGTTHITNDDGPNGGPLSEVRITATQPDVWRVRVSSLKGMQVGAYTLSAYSAPLSSGSVRGSVIGPSGATIANATIELISPETWAPFATTTTDGSGSYSFSAVPFGVPFLIAARQDGSGLVSVLSPEVRNLWDSTGVYNLLSAENSTIDRQLRLQLPWVEGKVHDGSLSYLAGLDVVAHDSFGNVIGTAKTDGGGGFKVPLPTGTDQCTVEVSDPAGVYRTTWYDRRSTEASADVVVVPTFHPLDITVRAVADPDFIDNYRAALAGVVVVFDRVAVPYGMVVGNQASQHPAAVGYRLIDGRTYQIHPQMQFWGKATVTMSIPAAEAANASNIHMFHWVDGAWQDVTSNVDAGNMKVTGETTSFSEFALMVSTSQPEVSTPASSPWSTALFAGLLALGVAFAGSRLRRA